MNTSSNPILSILVITHNQRELLKRCLDSVLGQKLNVPFEVIVSDDRSDDGTAEFMADLQNQITNDQLQITNLTQLVYTRCNSNDCDPKNVSERCGWNKLNVYNHARGKYFVNIDADDFLKSDDIYQAQLDMLEAHPECSMCQQGVWVLNDGDSIEVGHVEFKHPLLQDGKVIKTNHAFLMGLRDLNPSYMIRRHPEVDFSQLYGKYFDDTIITLHHFQYGPIVYLDRSDYVWVQYKTSITKTLIGDDNLVEYGLLFMHHIRFIPVFASEFMHEGLFEFVHMLKVLSEKNYHWQLTERTQAAFRETPGHVYCVFSHQQSTFLDRLYLRYIRLVAIFYSRFKLTNWKFLYGLLIDRKSASKIDWER